MSGLQERETPRSFTAISRKRNCYLCGAEFDSFGERKCKLCQTPRCLQPVRRGDPLTLRETQVLRLVVQALANKEIAYELHLSESAVKGHLSRLFAKAGVRGRGGLMLWGLRVAE